MNIMLFSPHEKIYFSADAHSIYITVCLYSWARYAA